MVSTIDPAIAEAFQSLSHRGKRFMIVKMDENDHPKLDVAAERNSTWADFQAAMPKDEPRWAVYDLEYKADGRQISKLIFVFYSPDNCKDSSARFKYAQGKESVMKKMTPTHKEFQICDHADLNEAEIIDQF